jgi:hypothetical protein
MYDGVHSPRGCTFVERLGAVGKGAGSRMAARYISKLATGRSSLQARRSPFLITNPHDGIFVSRKPFKI